MMELSGEGSADLAEGLGNGDDSIVQMRNCHQRKSDLTDKQKCLLKQVSCLNSMTIVPVKLINITKYEIKFLRFLKNNASASKLNNILKILF